jgi:hypothetical protein
MQQETTLQKFKTFKYKHTDIKDIHKTLNSNTTLYRVCGWTNNGCMKGQAKPSSPCEIEIAKIYIVPCGVLHKISAEIQIGEGIVSSWF